MSPEQIDQAFILMKEEISPYIKVNTTSEFAESIRLSRIPGARNMPPHREFHDDLYARLFSDNQIIQREQRLIVRKIALTVHELSLNSARDGDGDKRVICDYALGIGGVACKVSYDGDGFDYDAALSAAAENQNQLTDEMILAGEILPGGNGMYCLRNFPDKYVFNKRGNVIAVQFLIDQTLRN